jgi:hypothetical protein
VRERKKSNSRLEMGQKTKKNELKSKKKEEDEDKHLKTHKMRWTPGWWWWWW